MLGIAVVGTGHWGSNHARVYRELLSEGAINSLKICDSDEHRAKQWSQSLEVGYVTDYRDLIEDDSIQAVSIVTPSRTHYQLAKEFMEAGKDVLIEKPMTMDIEEAECLIDIAFNNNRILMVGHLFRYHKAVCELKRRIDAGLLGKIQIMIGSRMYFGLPRRDMGVIYALGIHEMDLFCYLQCVDYPNSLIATVSKSYSQDIEETAMITLDFGSTKGYALESWLVPVYGKKRELIVIGSEGSAWVDFLRPKELHIFDTMVVTEDGIPNHIRDEGKHTIALSSSEPLKDELMHFLSCMASRQDPLTNGAVGLRAVVMAEAALTSAKTGQMVTIA